MKAWKRPQGGSWLTVGDSYGSLYEDTITMAVAETPGQLHEHFGQPLRPQHKPDITRRFTTPRRVTQLTIRNHGVMTASQLIAATGSSYPSHQIYREVVNMLNEGLLTVEVGPYQRRTYAWCIPRPGEFQEVVLDYERAIELGMTPRKGPNDTTYLA